ncbi:MAG: Spy/CpxP family protein refolding chaperone [Acidimicrobiia bacterium]|nr:Spy/CpxP family protein refolding chaperone [Actinomycetota bacterium]MBL6927433.1 Spy/CpxP family protein refolding chaperone [Acidimicrobiia bacterium]
MRPSIRFALLGLFVLVAAGCGGDAVEASSPTTTADHTSAYAGEEARAIKTLSDNDIEELRNGRGWGLAKAAELNGVPGPSHVLEMKAEIGLSAEQEAEIQAIFEEMNAEARLLGEKMIDQEWALNQAFLNGEVTEESLTRMVDEISETLAELRVLHLATHLVTPGILTPEQVTQYNDLRGYLSNDDPCQNIPEGHDEAQFKLHNDCD